MSAPNTNVEKQAKDHRGPLTGMMIVVIFAVVLLAGLIIFIAVRGGTPQGADTQVRTGTPVTATEGTTGSGAPATDNVNSTNANPVPNPAAPIVPAEAVLEPDSAATIQAVEDPDTAAAEPAGTPPADGVDLEATVPGPSNDAATVGGSEN